MKNDGARNSRPISIDSGVLTLKQLDAHERKYSYSNPELGGKLSGPLLDFDFLCGELSDDQPVRALTHRSRRSTEIYNFRESLSNLDEQFSLARSRKRTKSSHRASMDFEINLKTCAIEVKDITEALEESEDSEIQIVHCDKSLGYESDVSNFTTQSVHSNWDQHFHKNPSTEWWFNRVDTNISESASDWDDSEKEAGTPLKSPETHSLQKGSPNESNKDSEYSSKNILAVCRQKDVTRARLITMDTTLAIIASWLIDSKTTKRWSENFYYRHRRYPNTNLGLSLGEILVKPLDFTCHGLLFSFGPVNGKLTYKIMVRKLGELKKLCKLDGVDVPALYRDSINRKSIEVDYELNDLSLSARGTIVDEIKDDSISFPERRSGVRVIDL